MDLRKNKFDGRSRPGHNLKTVLEDIDSCI